VSVLYGRDWPDVDDPGPEDNPTRSYEQTVVSSRMVPGDVFILGAPDHVPAVWGRGDEVLWAEGESLIIAGLPGVGKTTVAAQLVRGRIDPNAPDVLGYPIAPATKRVLYLAMDRPRQIARALRRTLGDLPPELLRERLTFWPGPPIAHIAKQPETLKGYADLAGADTIVVDSLKDAAIGLSDDEVGAGYNRARQGCIAAGIDLLELHHMVKRNASGGKPTTLADLYGSVWLSSGAGSVILLAGESGDPIVELLHLKQPAAEVGPMRVIHDHEAGTSAVWHSTDLLMMARIQSSGLTAKDAARAVLSREAQQRPGREGAAEVAGARAERPSRLRRGGRSDLHAGRLDPR
jgi:replicative DNA helicase